MGAVFDLDTAVEPVAEGRWRGELSDRWNIGEVPNGGYVMVLALRAIGETIPHPDPLTVTGHYLGRTAPGDVEIEVEVVKRGRSLSTAQASLFQEGRERLRVLATYGDLEAMTGPTALAEGPPHLGPETQLTSGVENSPLVRLAGQFDYRMPPEQAKGVAGEPTGDARTVGRIRFADGRLPDLLAMPLIVDAFPPAVFQLGHYGWTPTVELTVHLRARPAPGWLTCQVQTRYLQNGLLEEDVEAWDSDGRLVALSRQLALAPQ